MIFLLPIMLSVAIAVKLTSPGPALYWTERVGRHNVNFMMPKFRSMKVGTPAVATHKLTDPKSHLTSIGNFLRTSSLDELPQLWSVIVGDMSLVGPRPALFNQDDLIELRTKAGVAALKPGVTGYAQVVGRDELSISDKVDADRIYLEKQSLLFDVKIIAQTLKKVVYREGVSHQAASQIKYTNTTNYQILLNFTDAKNCLR